MKPSSKFRPSKNFLMLKKSNIENNRSSIINLNDSSNNPNQATREKEKAKSNRLKLAINKNGNENSENNPGDVNIIKFLNKSQLKRKTVNEPNTVTLTMANINNILYKRKLDGNKVKNELFPMSYYYMNLIFDRLIKPKSLFCIDKRYFIMHNFMVKIFDVSSHIKLLKYFTIFTDYFFSNELNGKRKISLF